MRVFIRPSVLGRPLQVRLAIPYSSPRFQPFPLRRCNLAIPLALGLISDGIARPRAKNMVRERARARRGKYHDKIG
jgi:hypothetical protein